MSVQIAPSIAAGNILRLEVELRRLEAGKADMIHVDVMDGHFVPYVTIGVPIVEALRKVAKIPLDVHIMVSNPDAVLDDYLNAGADILTFQIEPAIHAHRLCQRIRDSGRKAGVALNPSTPWRAIEFLLPVVDQVTVMTVNPGFSRQPHLPEMHLKINELARHLRENNLNITIQVDGGVSVENARRLYELGATNLVAGGAILGHADYGTAIAEIRTAATKRVADN